MKENNNSQQEDQRLVLRIRDGDLSAFRHLVHKYKSISFTLACSILKDGDTAEDVLQDAFMKVFDNIHKFRADSSFATWIYRIVVNTCLNAREKDKRHLYEDLSVAESLPAGNATSFDAMQQKERERYIAATLNMMKADEALLLRLFYLCELSVKEIQEVTDFSESNIKVILHRARKNMLGLLTKITGNQLNDLL